MNPPDDDFHENLNIRLVRVEMQLKRFIADLESEKGTRARAHADFEKRMREVEVANWRSAGALAVVVVLAQYLIPKLFP